jgi:Rod binding domain-containing protein
MTPSIIGSLTPGQQTPDVTAPTEAQRKAARDFEAIFLRQLLSSLEKGAGLGGKQSGGGQVFRSMMVSALADTAAEGGGIGLSEVILKAMLPPAPANAAVPALSSPESSSPESSSPAGTAPGELLPQVETSSSPPRSYRLGVASQALTEAASRHMFGVVRGGSNLETLEAPLSGEALLHPGPSRLRSPASAGVRSADAIPGTLPERNVR